MAYLPFFGYGPSAPRLLGQELGLTMTPSDLLMAAINPLLSRDYYRPSKWSTDRVYQMTSTASHDKNTFEINLDVAQFAPEEVTVTTADGVVVVEGKQEEKRDRHGTISRHFVRRYPLPEGCSPDRVKTLVANDGVLSIFAMRPTADSERSVPLALALTGSMPKETK